MAGAGRAPGGRPPPHGPRPAPPREPRPRPPPAPPPRPRHDAPPAPSRCGGEPAERALKTPPATTITAFAEPNMLSAKVLFQRVSMVIFTSNSLARPTVVAIGSIPGSAENGIVGPAAHERGMDHD